jgi:flagellar hook-length control protein FliK
MVEMGLRSPDTAGPSPSQVDKTAEAKWALKANREKRPVEDHGVGLLEASSYTVAGHVKRTVAAAKESVTLPSSTGSAAQVEPDRETTAVKRAAEQQTEPPDPGGTRVVNPPVSRLPVGSAVHGADNRAGKTDDSDMQSSAKSHPSLLRGIAAFPVESRDAPSSPLVQAPVETGLQGQRQEPVKTIQAETASTPASISLDEKAKGTQVRCIAGFRHDAEAQRQSEGVKKSLWPLDSGGREGEQALAASSQSGGSVGVPLVPHLSNHGLPSDASLGVAGEALRPSSPQTTAVPPFLTPAWPGIVQQLQAGAARVRLSFSLASLGPLTVSLQQTAGGLRVRFWAAESEVRQAVEAAVQPLVEAFQAAGIRVVSVSVASDEGGSLTRGQSDAPVPVDTGLRVQGITESDRGGQTWGRHTSHAGTVSHQDASTVNLRV